MSRKIAYIALGLCAKAKYHQTIDITDDIPHNDTRPFDVSSLDIDNDKESITEPKKKKHGKLNEQVE